MYHLGTRFGRSLALLVLAAALGVGACSKSDSTAPAAPALAIALSGTGYNPHAGETLHVAVVDTANADAVLGRSTVTVANDGTFTTTPSATLTSGGLYRVDFYADGGVVGIGTPSGTCDGADHNWQVAVIDANGDGINDEDTSTPLGTPAAFTKSVTLNTTHNATYLTTDCSSFPSYTVTLDAADYLPHILQPLHWAVVYTSTNAVVDSGTTSVNDAGGFTVTSASVLGVDSLYTVDFYVDGNTAGANISPNGFCDAAGTDHQWRYAVNDPDGDGANNNANANNTAVAGGGTPSGIHNNVTITTSHGTGFTSVCSNFPGTGYRVTLTGTGYSPHEGETIHAAVIDTANSNAVLGRGTALVSGGAFNLAVPEQLPLGGLYAVDFYADGGTISGPYPYGQPNGTCDTVPTDHQWRVSIDDSSPADGTNDQDTLTVSPGTPTAMNGNVTVVTAHTTNFTDVCASF